MKSSHLPEERTAMTPIAAYHVMIAIDHEREMRHPRQFARAPRPSRAIRIITALGTLVRLGRPANTQPI
jgi:hypothetical protein